MATKILRVFQEFTSEGYVPMPPAGNIDYGVTIAGTFPSTTPATFQTDITDIEVEVTEVTDFYVWIRSHGSEWNYQYTRNVRVYPDSPDINNVVMGIIIANLDNTVPYTGATENVDLGEFGIKAGHVGFDLTPTDVPTAEGTLSWNDGDGTLDLILKGGNVTLQVGQELVARCYNAEATTLVDGEIVYIYGSQGNRVSVKRASASSEMSSSVTFGMVTESIASGAEGFVTISGVVNKLNTSGLTAGTALWLGTTPGTYTPTKPTAPIHSVLIGYVERVHATVGAIYVKIQNGYELDELHNVKITSVAENDFLIYDATNSVWENRAILKTNGYLPYFDSTEIFKQSPIFTDGTNVTINSLDVITGGGTANYIPKLGTTKTLVNSLLYDNGTNVGIGSTNPQFKFEVRGGAMGVYASTSYYGKQEIANNDYMFTSGSGFYFRTNDATATVFAGRINNSGNWGIGILNPTQKLDVNGNINIPTGSNYLINGIQLDTDDIPQGSTNQYLTEAGLYPYMYNFASGEVKWNVVTHQFYMNQASSTTNGWLSNTDWNTFNNKENAITAGTTAQYWRGDKSWQTLNTSVVPEGTNLYYTDARSRSAISSSATGLTYTSGTGVFSLTAGYAIPTTSALGNYDTAYNRSLTAVAVSGTTTKTITLTKQDGTTLTASWSDLNTDAVTSVFGRTGAVVATSGDYTTSLVTEGTNLYYTDARARGALSFVAGSGAYNSTTGVITIPTNTSQLTNGANFITLASLSASSPLSYNNTTGAFSIAQASGSTNGFLSSTDWNTFNNKQNALGYTPVPTTRTLTINGTSYDLSADRTWTIAGTISGLTTNYIPKATGATTLGNSLIYDNGTTVALGNTANGTGYAIEFNTNATQPRIDLIDNGTYTGFFKTNGLVASIGNNSANAFTINTGGSEKLRVNAGGNVSIGNTNNTYKLDVSGTGNFSGAVSVIGALNVGSVGSLSINAGSGATPLLTQTTNYTQLYTRASNVGIYLGGTGDPANYYDNSIHYFRSLGGGSTRMTLDNSGNLGLGVTPSAWSTGKAFELSSSGNAIWSYGQDNIYLLSNSYFNGGWKYGGNGYATNYTQYQGQHQWYNAPSNSSGAGSAISFTQAMTLDASGRLAVGNTSPNARISASSSGRIIEAIYTAASNGNALRIDQQYAGGSNFTDFSLIYVINKGSNPYITFNNGTSDIFSIANSGAATFSSSITTTSIINSGSGVNNVTLNAGNLDFYNAGASNKFIRVADDSSTINAIGFSKSGSTATTWFPSGNVGIGTTSPSYKLDVSGAIRAYQNSTFDSENGPLISANGTTPAKQVSIGYDANIDGGYISTIYSGVSWKNLILQGGGGNVGIGTTSPTARLTVIDEVRVKTASTTGVGLSKDSSGAYLYNIDNTFMAFGTNNTERMRITSTGNVGIGTASPSGKLTVANLTSATMNNGLVFAAADLAGADNGHRIGLTYGFDSTIRSSIGLVFENLVNNFNSYITFGTGSANAERMRITSSGNVGIGTTSPNYTLDITGAQTYTARIYSNSTDTRLLIHNSVSGGGGTLNGGLLIGLVNSETYFYNYQNGSAIFGTNGTERMRITSGGNVGIGRTSADHRLDVQGNVLVRNTLGNASFYFAQEGDNSSTFYQYNNGTLKNVIASNGNSYFTGGNVGIATSSPQSALHIGSGNFVLGSNPSVQYKFNVQGLSGNYISYWTPTFSGADQNGIISHNGSGLGGLRPLGFTGTEFVFGNTVTGGGLVQVNGDVNISGTFRVNGTAIGTGGGGVSGSGTTNKVARWSSSTSLTNSLINDDGTNVSIYSGNASQWISITNSNLQLSEVSSSVGGVLDFKTGSPSLTTRVRIDSVGRFSLNTTSNPLYTNILHTILASSDSNYRTTISPVFGDNYSVFSYMGSANTGLFIGSGGTVASDTSILSFSNSSGDSAINFCGHKFNTGYYLSLRVKWNTIQLPNIPTSASGLSSGDIWKDGSGYLRIV